MLYRIGPAHLGLTCMAGNEEKIEILRHRISHLESYEVTLDELQRLQYEDPQRSYELTFSLTALSVALAILIPLVIGEPPKISNLRFSIFVALIVVGFVFFLFFGIRWLNNLRQRNSLFVKIRARQIGPVGEKGAEIPASELAELPSEDASGAELEK